VNNELRNDIRDVSNLVEVEQVEKRIPSEDRSFVNFNLSELYSRAATLTEDGLLKTQFAWKAKAFRPEFSRALTGEKDGHILRVNYISGESLDYWKELPAEAFKFFYEESQKKLDPPVRCQYLACLWEGAKIWKKVLPEINVKTLAEQLTLCCLECVKDEIAQPEDIKGCAMRAVEFLDIAVFIAKRFNFLDFFKSIVDPTLDYSEKTISEAPHWTLGFSRVLMELAYTAKDGRIQKIVSDTQLSKIRELIQSVHSLYETTPGAETDPMKTLEPLVLAERLLGNKVSQAEVFRRCGEGYTKRANLPWPGWMRASIFKDAAEQYFQAGEKDLGNQALADSRRVMRESIKNNEMQQIGGPLTITHNKIDEMIQPFFQGASHPFQVFSRMGQILFASSIQTGQEAPKEYSVFRSLVPTIKVIDDRVKATEYPTEDKSGILHEEWKNEITLENGTRLGPIFEKIRETFVLTAQDVSSVLGRSELWKTSDRPFIRHASKAFVRKDYISFIHVYTPRLEHLIRHLIMATSGAKATALGRDNGLSERSLGELLREATEKEIFPENLGVLLQATLSEEWGLNIRNRVAHGLLLPEESDEDTANRLFHVGILLNQLVLLENSCAGS